MSHDEQQIRELMTQYEVALNAGSTAQVMPLYTPDGVFMPQGSPSSAGAAAVQAAYDAVFAAIQLHVRFEIAELQQIAPEWAFVRTNSAGTVRILSAGAGAEPHPEANQELFLLRKLGDVWKIARYCFSTTLVPHA